MWKNWKKKVSDFFYEDIIEDDDELELKREVNEVSQRSVSNRTVNTKMTYQYPKEQITPFRFPVIPDENIERKRDKKRVKHTVKRNLRRSYRENNHASYGYKRKESVKDLEDIPAYIRRRKAEERAQQIETTHDDAQAQKKENQRTILNHTKPDELDRIFKIRDGILNPEIEKNEKVVKETEVAKQEKDQFFSSISELEPIKEQPILQPELQSESEIQQTETIMEKQSTSFDYPIPSSTNHLEEVEVETEESMESMEWLDEEEIEIDVPNYLLNDPIEPDEDDSIWLIEQQSLLEQTLTHFNVDAKIVNVTQGPSVTRFEIQPALGVKVSKIRNLADDIKLNMAAKDIRIEAPIPGKNTIGIEVPNQYPQVVSLQEIIETEEFQNATSPLTIALGLTIEGNPLITNIGKMPHGLIAGATGSGKSVCINTILLSLLYKANHHEVKFLLIDPKMVELTPYNGIPHLISPVITDAKAATISLKWAVEEMENRYEKFVEAGVRNIIKYNEKITKQNRSAEKMPYIVIVIDELADLMIVSPQEVEDAICRIAQKARACGIHLLLATQRPSVDVITGLIKANIPTRIAFSVSSQVDSRTMIDTVGAEKLLGKGDMLFVENGKNKSVRLQGPFVSDEEIDRVANYMRSIAKPNYLFEQEQLLLDVQDEEEDELLNEVISFVIDQNQASTSLLQRRFRIGYNRAARLIDTLENKGIVSAQNGSKPREVLVSKNQIEELL